MKSKILIFGLLTIFILLFMWSSITSNSKTKSSIVTNVSPTLSNRKIGWGIKRGNSNNQPDLGANNKKLIEENEDIAMGNPDKKYIYLTFDNGYEAGYTPKILDALKENNVKAAFFITGHYLNANEDLVKRMIDEGHIVRKPYC